MAMDCKLATLQRAKSKLLVQGLEAKRATWKQQGLNLGQSNKLATEILRQAIPVKTFAQLITFNDTHFAGGGAQAIINLLDTI